MYYFIFRYWGWGGGEIVVWDEIFFNSFEMIERFGIRCVFKYVFFYNLLLEFEK